MTSIVGIRTHSKGKKYIVLGCDSQITYQNERTIEATEKKQGATKIVTGGASKTFRQDSWAMCDAGIDTSRLRTFYRGLRRNGGGRKKIATAIGKKYFEEINQLNSRISKRNADSYTSHFLLASRLPKVELYFVDSHGNMHLTDPEDPHNKDFLVIGSGSTSLKDYIRTVMDIRDMDMTRMPTGRAMMTAFRGVDDSEDLFTGRFADLVVVGEEGIEKFGSEIRRHLRREGKKKLVNMIEEKGYDQ